MRNKRIRWFLLLCVWGLTILAQNIEPKKVGDVTDDFLSNKVNRKEIRDIQYTPDGNDFVCINGQNRFTRALYGSHTAFRLETSDRPVFASFMNSRDSKHIRFELQLQTKKLALDSLQRCESRYTAGRRTYQLSDPILKGRNVKVTALALFDRDGAIWKFEMQGSPSLIISLVGFISETRSNRLNRNGDMGVDPADCFEAPLHPQKLQSCREQLNKVLYVLLENQTLKFLPQTEGSSIFDKAEKTRSLLAATLHIETPDPFFNTLGETLAVAADGLWDGQVWMHGAIGWRMPLPGWRAAYVGDVLGWHDRARTHFNAYAASQVTDIPVTIPHPAQDSVLNLARAVERWGTPMYSNGYICRNPKRNNQMHHYDMNLVYMDELFWHFNWTGDLDYAREIWPVITRHLAWEKLNYDPDNDGLYDAYCCIWASDALYYNSGAVTHSSAYNYRANKLAAQLAQKIGKDAKPYKEEAEKIEKAMNSCLWMPSRGHWAEYQDFMGHKRLHESAAVYTIYHAIDSETADPFQTYQATRYVDVSIPHISVAGRGLKGKDYFMVSTSDWLPYAWSTNNVVFAENYHTALAYFQAGRADVGFKLLKSAVLDGMYLGRSPGNIGQISYYDAMLGECYRDFGDPIGMMSRVLLQGLYGLLPDALNGKFVIRPGFPVEWNKASITTSDISYSFLRKGNIDIYQINQQFKKPLEVTLQVNARMDAVKEVKVNSQSVKWEFAEAANGYPNIVIQTPATSNIEISISWEGKELQMLTEKESSLSQGKTLALKIPSDLLIEKVYDPQGCLSSHQINKALFSANLQAKEGHHTFFIYTRQGEMSWWQPVNINVESYQQTVFLDYSDVNPERCRMVDFDSQLNASVHDIFKNKYLAPRSPYTTLEIPTQGIGDWCQPKYVAKIDDSGLRNLVRDNIFRTSLGVPFRVKASGSNILYTSLWDNYPDSVSVTLSGTATHAYLLMAGSTNQMQSRIANGVIRVNYVDGTSKRVELINPDNWCPIESDYYIDGKAFSALEPRPYRLHFKSGKVSRDIGTELGLQGGTRQIDGGAGELLDIPLDSTKELKSLTLETLSNDVVIGLMAVTLQ